MATMLDCKKVQPLLSEYVDGTLTEESAWGVKMHLASCAVCQRVADDFSGTARLLGALEYAEPSANFEAMLAARLADLSMKPYRPALRERIAEWWYARGRVGRPALASAAALAFLVPLVVATFALRQGAVEPVGGNVGTTVARQPVTPSGSDGDSLERLYDDHAAYSSSLLLGDSSGVLTPMDSRL